MIVPPLGGSREKSTTMDLNSLYTAGRKNAIENHAQSRGVWFQKHSRNIAIESGRKAIHG